MLQCKDIEQEASNYINGDIPLVKRVGLFFHLMVCRCCRNYLQQIKRTIFTISTSKPQEKNEMNNQVLAKNLHQLSKNK